MRRFRRRRILRAQAQDARNKNPEWTLIGFRHQGNNRSLPFGDFPTQNANDGVNVAIFHGAGLFGVNWLNWNRFISQIVTRSNHSSTWSPTESLTSCNLESQRILVVIITNSLPC